jgi:opacity protein-like surface antigen
MRYVKRMSLWLLLVAVASVPNVAMAQDVDTSVASPDGFAVSMGFGFAQVRGEWGTALNHGLDADINLFYLFQSGIRLGIGAYYVSYVLQPQFGAEKVNNVQLQALLGYGVQFGRLRPYGQARLAYVRLKLEGFHGTGPPPPEGENPAARRHGVGAILLGGSEFIVSRQVTFDTNVWYGFFATQPLDLDAVNAPEVSKGQSWGMRIGIVWYTSR